MTRQTSSQPAHRARNPVPAHRAPTVTAVHTGAPRPDRYGLHDQTALRAALAAAADDRIIYDLDGIGRQYAAL
ncbi:hypothetical protein ABT048_06165, partial [Kitasatospora sp. NPDC096140]